MTPGSKPPDHPLRSVSRTRRSPGEPLPAASESGTATPADLLSVELGPLLSSALRKLVAETEATRAEAWTLVPGGSPVVAAIHIADSDSDTAASPTASAVVEPPDARALEALFRLPSATDLTQRGLDATLAGLPLERGLVAAAALVTIESPSEPRPIAVLLLGLPQRANGEPTSPRPRTLAALDQVVARLHEPAVTASAIARLSDLDHEVLRVARLATIGDLLAEVVHEVRNPLVSVKTFLQLLPDHLDDPDFTTNFRSVVIGEVGRMERLLETVLRQVRPSAATEPEPAARLGTILESVGRLLEQRALERSLELTVDIGADLPLAAMDEDPLRQIVLNLALNAFEATPAGGKVRLTGVTGSIDDEPAVEFIVDDEGPGVPEEQRTQLFEPFFSTRPERPGGLGLTVCRRLARQVGGRISVEESPTGGARFRVALPALPALPSPP